VIARIELISFREEADIDALSAQVQVDAFPEREELAGVLLDLRGNGGGELLQVIRIADIFFKQKQTPLTTQYRVKFPEEAITTMT